MKLPLKWLKEYVDFNVTNEEFVERMMWRGFEIAEVCDEMPGISGVVVCRILEIKQHENADKLKVCSVDVGKDEPITIVTNAQNLYVGAQVPVAVDGAVLSGGFKIAPTVMRGVESFGMFCSGKELNLIDADYPGASADCVLIFKEEHPCGQSIQDAVGLNSVVFDIELTPNRADCQSIIGICREAAAALGQKFIEPVTRHIAGEGNEKDFASVTINNSVLCPRYTARVITDLKIEPSPVWMQKRLRSVGLRPINNIVDITNYVLTEYGHPMHAFDLSCIDGGNIVVRNAQKDEKIVTLDDKPHVMSEDMLLIADPTKGVGVAGVMGGQNSEITENTKSALFESAVFIPSNIRSTSRKLKTVSDSAQRFMRGVEPVNAYLALERAVELVDELGAGKVVGNVIDVCNADISEKNITIDCTRVNRITGFDFTPEYMSELLGQINIAAVPNGSTLKVTVPHFRTDIEDGIESDCDIAEEVARLHGYDKLESTLMHGETFCGAIPEAFRDEDTIKDCMVCCGAYEMYNFNFTAPSDLDSLRISDEDEKRLCVKLLNPFGEDQSLMRTTLIPGMLRSLAVNTRYKTGHGRYYEVGNVHINNNPDLPEERKMLGLAYMGSEDFYTIKGSLEQLFEVFGIKNIRYVAGGGNYLCPGKKAMIFADNEPIGEVGALHPNVIEAWDLNGNILIAEISVSKLLSHKSGTVQYRALPKFPASDRDIAVVVDDKVLSEDVCNCILACDCGILIENVRLFDVYKGIGIPVGKKSMAFSFSLRLDDRTLTQEDIDGAMSSIVIALETNLGAKLRS